MWKFFVLLLASSVLSLTSYINENQKSDSVYVDLLTDNYLVTEKDIWNDIVSNANLDGVIRKIHSEHLNLFSNSFIANQNLDRHLLIDRIFLYQKLKEVNLNLLTVKDNYLHKTTDPESLKREILEMAMYNSNTTLIDDLYDAVVGEDFFGYVKMTADKQKCTKRGQTMESTNYELFQYYNNITKFQLCAYALVQLSYMFLVAYGEKSYIERANSLRNTFKERTKNTQERVRELMILANRDVWKCDLLPQSYDDHRYQITHFLEGFVDNEVNLNTDNDCKKSCSDYSITKSYGCLEDTLCDKERHNPKSKCNGTVLNCEFIEADMTVCLTEKYKVLLNIIAFENAAEIFRDVRTCVTYQKISMELTTCSQENYSNRRYTNIVLGSGKKLGHENCYRTSTSISSWTRWFVQCSNCFCLCDEPNENSERYFSLKEVLSDTSSNKIVTGVGLYKEKGVFTWGIHQAEFLSNGEVNLTKPWNAFTEIEKFQHNEQVDGIDFHTLTWQNRSINLDTIIAPVGTVVTGLRFKVNEGVLNIEIRATKFEFSTGRLFDDHQWLSNDNENVHRTPINLLKSDIPSRATDFSVPNTEVNKFVQFQPSGIDQDVAQTTIPFIDSQIVETFDRKAPLSGVGIIFKDLNGFGGYIAPKVITYDMSPHIGDAYQI